MLNIINADKNMRDYYHVITFQERAVIAEILSGTYDLKEHLSDRTKDCHLIDTLKPPFYCYLSMYHNDGGHEINLPALYYTWSNLMGFMQLDGRDIMELYIPKSENVIIGFMGDGKGTKPVEAPFDDDIELVVSHIDPKWIAAIYRKTDTYSDYGITTLTPEILNPNVQILSSKPFKVSGDGYAEENILRLLPADVPSGKYLGELRYFCSPWNRGLFRDWVLLRQHPEVSLSTLAQISGYDKIAMLDKYKDYFITDEDVSAYIKWRDTLIALDIIKPKTTK